MGQQGTYSVYTGGYTSNIAQYAVETVPSLTFTHAFNTLTPSTATDLSQITNAVDWKFQTYVVAVDTVMRYGLNAVISDKSVYYYITGPTAHNAHNLISRVRVYSDNDFINSIPITLEENVNIFHYDNFILRSQQIIDPSESVSKYATITYDSRNISSTVHVFKVTPINAYDTIKSMKVYYYRSEYATDVMIRYRGKEHTRGNLGDAHDGGIDPISSLPLHSFRNM